MDERTQAEVLDVARRYLVGESADPEVAEITVPEFHEPMEVFSVAFRGAGYEFETVVESFGPAEISGDTASVHARQRLVPKGRKGTEQSQELTIQLVNREGWKVRDLLFEGSSLAARCHRVLVEPAEAEGIAIRGWARDQSDGTVCVALLVRNDSQRRWRVRGAGAVWEKGRLWFLSQAVWKMLFLGSEATLPPGIQLGAVLAPPAKIERVWLRASRRGSLRSQLFALSWEQARLDASAVPFKWNKRLSLRLAVRAVPFVGLAVLVAVFASVPAALVASALFAGTAVLETHWCLYRLKRKLARFRAQSASVGGR